MLYTLCICWVTLPSALCSQVAGDTTRAVEAVWAYQKPTAVADMSLVKIVESSIAEYQSRLTAGMRFEWCPKGNLCFHGGGFMAMDNPLEVTPLNGNPSFLHLGGGVKLKFYFPLLGEMWGSPIIGLTRETLPQNPVSYYGFVAGGVGKDWAGPWGRVSLSYEQIPFLFNVNEPGSNGLGIHDIRAVASVRGVNLGTSGWLKSSRLDFVLEGGHVKETPGEPKYGMWTLHGTLRFGSTIAPCIIVGSRSVLSPPRMEAMYFVAGCVSVRTKGP